MSLYLDEIWLHWDSPETAQRALTTFRSMDSESFNWPPGVRLVAGPWFSNEEAKIVLILDIADHAATFTAFTLATAHGLIARRRLTPVVAWQAIDDVLALLPESAG
jgi:hypothetical protein